MHIWTIERWKRYVPPQLITSKSHIHLLCDKNTNGDLKVACHHFIQWAKKEYYFPIPLHVKLKNQVLLKTKDGGTAALFKKFCKRDFCDEVRDFKIPEPEAVAS